MIKANEQRAGKADKQDVFRLHIVGSRWNKNQSEVNLSFTELDALIRHGLMELFGGFEFVKLEVTFIGPEMKSTHEDAKAMEERLMM